MSKEEKATKGLHLRVTEEYWKELDSFCRETGLSKSVVLRRGFILYRDQHAGTAPSTTQEDDR